MKNLFEILKTGKLIGKYLTGKESVKELEQLKEWIDNEVNNESLFNSIKDDKRLTNSIREFDKFDKEAAWSKYITSISKQSKKKNHFRWRIAASIMVIVSISSIALFNHLSKDEPIVAEVKQTILPGEPKAYIEFSSGHKFDLQNLDDKQQDKLAQDAGIVIDGNTLISSKVKKAERKPELLAMVTPRGGEYKMILNDGTQVWLNADSRLEFPNKFDKKERKVKLSGEAFFSVSKDVTRPFIISLNGMDIEVLGTEFNISAYDNDNFIQTTLVEGKVSIKTNLETLSEQNILTPGKQANFNREDKSVEIRKVDVNQYIAWKDGRFVFDCQTLSEITKELGRWYDVDFVFANSELRDIPFSGEFLRYENIDKVYGVVRKTGTKLDFKQKNGRTIEIRAKEP